jgi:hypothetical protein
VCVCVCGYDIVYVCVTKEKPSVVFLCYSQHNNPVDYIASVFFRAGFSP